MSNKLLKAAIFWTALCFGTFQLIVPLFVPIDDLQLRSVHVFLGLATVFLTTLKKKEKKDAGFPFWGLILIGIALLANINIFLNWLSIYTNPAGKTVFDMVLGVALILLVIDAARRSTGWAVPICVIIVFVYVFLGTFLPGSWSHPGFSLEHVIESFYYSSLGIYGSVVGMSATFIAMFIIFGALLGGTVSGGTFIELALIIAGKYKGGPAKVAVVASTLFGTIMGSSVATISLTGQYTIPLMKRLGYNPNFAGGVEAMSSIGGPLSPPIMGSAAFIMAQMTETPYIKICAYALIPCLLFYTGIFAGIHAKALQLKLRPVPDELIPTWKSVLTWHKLAPLVIPATLLMVLLIKGYLLMRAGFYACLAVIILHVFSDFSFSGMKERAVQMIKAMSEGGKQVSKIVPVLVCLNVFTVVLGLTGVAPKISELILQIGGETLVGALLFSAIVPLALGTALPVAATYILSAAVIAPGLVKVGIDLISVHMFLFYWSTLASITPPTCVPAVIAANIGGGDWLKVAVTGMKLGFVAFLIPFFFVIDPSLIGIGVPMYVFERVVSGFIGTIFVSFGIFGYSRSDLAWALRLMYVVGGVFLLYPNTKLSIIGLAIVIGGFILESLFIQWNRRTLEKAT